jgi:hypothetical protein
MKLLLLYGPPAVGKLTIAKEIGRLIGFRSFMRTSPWTWWRPFFHEAPHRIANCYGTSVMRCSLKPRERTSMDCSLLWCIDAIKNNTSELLNETLSHWEPQSPFEAATQWDSLRLNTDVLHPIEAAQQVGVSANLLYGFERFIVQSDRRG